MQIITVRTLRRLSTNRFTKILLLMFRANRRLIFSPHRQINERNQFTSRFQRRLRNEFAFIHYTRATRQHRNRILMNAITRVHTRTFGTLHSNASIFTNRTFIRRNVNRRHRTQHVTILTATNDRSRTRIRRQRFTHFGRRRFHTFNNNPILRIRIAITQNLTIRFNRQLRFLTKLNIIRHFTNNQLIKTRRMGNNQTSRHGRSRPSRHRTQFFALARRSSPLTMRKQH